MPQITPFRSIRPNPILASRIAALPYDVYNRKEALAEVEREPRSFLRIDRAETQFPEDVDLYDERVYQKARELLERSVADGSFIMEEKPYYYIYELTMNGRTQTGIAACSSIDDYIGGVIRKHENTRQDKELDRIRHVDTTDAHTGPIFLAYRGVEVIDRLTQQICRGTPLYDFASDDGVGHKVWKIAAPGLVSQIEEAF